MKLRIKSPSGVGRGGGGVVLGRALDTLVDNVLASRIKQVAFSRRRFLIFAFGDAARQQLHGLYDLRDGRFLQFCGKGRSREREKTIKGSDPRRRDRRFAFIAASLESQGELDHTADVANVVIKNILVRITVGEGVDRADPATVRHPISSRSPQDLTDILPAVLMIISRNDPADRVNGKLARQIDRVAEITFINVSAWRLVVAAKGRVRVRSDRKLLRAVYQVCSVPEFRETNCNGQWRRWHETHLSNSPFCLRCRCGRCRRYPLHRSDSPPWPAWL